MSLIHENESNVQGTSISPVENVCAEVGLGFPEGGDDPLDGGEVGFLESSLEDMENGGPVVEVLLVGLRFINVRGSAEMVLGLGSRERTLIPRMCGSLYHLRLYFRTLTDPGMCGEL